MDTWNKKTKKKSSDVLETKKIFCSTKKNQWSLNKKQDSKKNIKDHLHKLINNVKILEESTILRVLKLYCHWRRLDEIHSCLKNSH